MSQYRNIDGHISRWVIRNFLFGQRYQIFCHRQTLHGDGTSKSWATRKLRKHNKETDETKRFYNFWWLSYFGVNAL